MIDGGKLADYAIEQIGSGYVFGSQGHLYTPQLAEKWATQRRAGKTRDYFLEECKEWFGMLVFDCSGLIVKGCQVQRPSFYDRTADTFRNQAAKVYALSSAPNNRGLLIWRPGHIGIICGDFVVEAAGKKIGVVKSHINRPASGKAWKAIIQHRDIQPTPVASPEAPAGLYVVKKGDTLYDIAKRHKIDVSKLYAANRAVIGGDPGMIQPGMVLKI